MRVRSSDRCSQQLAVFGSRMTGLTWTCSFTSFHTVKEQVGQVFGHVDQKSWDDLGLRLGELLSDSEGRE